MDETIRMLFFTGLGILIGVLLFFFTEFSDFETASADLEDAKFWYDLGFDEVFDRGKLSVACLSCEQQKETRQKENGFDASTITVDYPKIEYLKINHETGRLGYKMEKEEETYTDYYCIEVKQGLEKK